MGIAPAGGPRPRILAVLGGIVALSICTHLCKGNDPNAGSSVVSSRETPI
jgi:hypothetical protein